MLCILVVIVAGYVVFAYGAMPLGALVHPDMKANFLARPWAIYTHVFASVTALMLGPLQFSTRLRQARRALHRWTGRIYLGVGVLIGGLSGLYVAAFAYGGAMAKLGFALLAVCWLYSGWRAYAAIRRGAVDEHRRWMMRNFALTLAAVSLRLYLPASMLAGIPFGMAYPIIAWLCWLPNLLVAEWIIRTSPRRSPRPRPVLGPA